MAIVIANSTNLMDSMLLHLKKTALDIANDPIANLLVPAIELVLVVFLTYITLRVIDRVIDHMFKLSKVETNKAHTLRKLIKSIAHYALYFIAFLTILSEFGINLGPILAGAGILGLAIGFGAQSLVKDVINGFFLIFERQIEVGDVVEVNGKIRGTVEEVGLRITKIREYNQRLHYLANGTISQVTNYNREKMRAIVPITVPYDTDLDAVTGALQDVCETIANKFEDTLVHKPEVVGVTNMDLNGVQFTITALSEPSEYSNLEREIRKEIILALNRNNISIPHYPESVHDFQTN